MQFSMTGTPKSAYVTSAIMWLTWSLHREEQCFVGNLFHPAHLGVPEEPVSGSLDLQEGATCLLAMAAQNPESGRESAWLQVPLMADCSGHLFCDCAAAGYMQWTHVSHWPQW